jgi:hypothetical protein
MNFGNELHRSSMWDLLEICHKYQAHTLPKVCKNCSGFIITLEVGMKLYISCTFFQILYNTALYINVSELQSLYIKTEVTRFKI